MRRRFLWERSKSAMHFHNAESKLQYYKPTAVFSQATFFTEMNDLVDKNHEISEQACRLINDKLEILNYTKTSQMICVIRDLEIVRQQCGKNVHVVRNGIVCFICFIVAVAIERHRLCTKIYDNVQRRFDLQTFEPLAVYFRMNCVRDLW